MSGSVPKGVRKNSSLLQGVIGAGCVGTRDNVSPVHERAPLVPHSIKGAERIGQAEHHRTSSSFGRGKIELFEQRIHRTVRGMLDASGTKE